MTVRIVFNALFIFLSDFSDLISVPIFHLSNFLFILISELVSRLRKTTTLFFHLITQLLKFTF